MEVHWWRVVAAVLVLPAGLAVTYFALIRLGWRRHGTSPTDLGWLHFEWLGSLSDHPAHFENLATLAVGAALMALAAALLVRAAHRV